MKTSARREKKSIMARHPRLVAHLICESLGYFTPTTAARAVERHQVNQPMFCEWYDSMVRPEPGESYNDAAIRVGRRTLKHAIAQRHLHKGFMSEYQAAIRLVRAAIEKGDPCTFMSW